VGITACGGGASGPQSKSYTLTVTGASSPGGTVSHSTTLTLIVQ